MPSSVIAQVAEITDLRPHPDADRLELATLGGWQIVCGKGLYKEGERVIYITPDSLITENLADTLGIRQHLQSVKNPDGSFVTNEQGQTMWRVRQAKLRGEPSFGTTIPADVALAYDADIYGVELGTNFAEKIGIGKYEPAMRASAGDAEVDHPLFPKYTSIENVRNFPNVIPEGEMVSITEKIHGTNCRVGLVEGEWMAGSHGLRRKMPSENIEDWAKNTYWYPLSLEPVRNLLERLGQDFKQVVLYGEIYGNVQKNYTYGKPNGIGFRAFDLILDGNYINFHVMDAYCNDFGVETVPELEQMPYSFESVAELAEGITESALSGSHGIEGVVIRPFEERYDHKVGRVILKYITTSYMFNKNKSDFKEV